MAVIVFVHGWRYYYSLPVVERADGDPIAENAEIWLGVMLVLAALFLAGLVAGATLERRLSVALAVIILIASLGVLVVPVWLASGPGPLWSMWRLVWLPFAYVPAVVVIRLVWQSSAGRG